MILETLTLHDFGLYAGCQTIKLAPASPNKPVVLLGGLNGGGKTTLLDAIHLALYGIRARTSNRNGTAYPEYLRKCINTKARPSDGASLKLEFTNRVEGEEHRYLVHRSWAAHEVTVRENLEVFKDGVLDPQLTESWAEYVEEFLPLGLSRLFLFDGEKIEALADLEHSSEALTTAVSSLLGLDVIDQLGADLLTLEQRKRSALKETSDRAEVEALESRITEQEQRLAALGGKRAEIQVECDRCEKKKQKLEGQFRRQGGETFQRRDALESERTQLEGRIQEIEADLVELGCGVLPLALVRDLLASVSHQRDREEAASQAHALNRILIDRDAEMMAMLKSAQIPQKAIASLGEFLERDLGRRVAESQTEAYLSLSNDAAQQLGGLLHGGLSEELQRAQKGIAQLREVQESMVQLERKLQAVPDEEVIKRFIEQLESARVQLQVAYSQLKDLDEAIKEATGQLEKDQDRRKSLLQRAVDENFEREDNGRVVKHSARVRGTLREFRKAVVTRHIHRIEALVLESFQLLLRKKDLVRSIRIDPGTFRVELRGKEDEVVSPERLSAGERQLFAVSLLWGLARAAGRPLPAVIDTPLGRLDAEHRSHLVERYFPFASHQVLLLSTDKEIDREYYELLKPYVGHEYRLVFDPKAKATRVEPGYFW